MKRREFFETITRSGGAAALTAITPWTGLLAEAAPATQSRKPKRFVFFIQNHGFNERHALPRSVDLLKSDAVEEIPLAEHRLPEWIAPLSEIQDRLTIVHGLSGRHIQPRHSSMFGCLGGYVRSVSPRAISIDAALAKALPAPIPLLALSWESLENMRRTPVMYGSSAWAANSAIASYADPRMLYQNIFGSVAEGEAQAMYDAETAVFDFVKDDVLKVQRGLPSQEKLKLDRYFDGLQGVVSARNDLQSMADRLKKYQPEYHLNFDDPLFETDWWDASLEVGIAALQAGVTNVLTIASGACKSGGTFFGLDLQSNGHDGLGHSDQLKNPDWVVLRQYNMEMIVQIVRALEAVPEDGGTMMDNTVIVYTSCHGEAHHSTGFGWPYLLIGDLGGTLRSGRLVQYPNRRWLPDKGTSGIVKHERTVNALYCTLLNAAGVRCQSFNQSGDEARRTGGPLEELLA